MNLLKSSTEKKLNVLCSVVDSGYCVGCGLCAVVCPSGHLQMQETLYGEYNPGPGSAPCRKSCNLCLQVCPFSDEHGLNEDTLGKEKFREDKHSQLHPTMGWVRDTYVGALADDGQRLQAASGGLTTAVLCKLLYTGEIDAAVVPQPLSQRPWFQMQIVTTEEQVRSSRGSVYNVLFFSKVIQQILADKEDKRYALVALPCVIKAVRLAQKVFPKLRRRIVFVLGLTCGGSRSLKWSDLLTNLAGIERVSSICYRVKTGARRANDYRFQVMSTKSKCQRQVRFQGLFGYTWLNEFGGLKSCLFCDDIFAELADATFMDAWLPDFGHDPRGTSLVISRTKVLSELLKFLFTDGTCQGGPIAADMVAASQRGVIRRKREALADRVTYAGEKGYVPRKRLDAAGVVAQGIHTELAMQQLKRWQRLRELLRTTALGGQGGRWQAYLTCWQGWFIVKSCDLQIHSTKALFGFGGLPGPRALLHYFCQTRKRKLVGKKETQKVAQKNKVK